VHEEIVVGALAHEVREQVFGEPLPAERDGGARCG